MIHDFDYVWGMVRDLRATSSTIDKVGIIEDYCNINNIGASFTKKVDRKSTRLNSSHVSESRMPSSA